MAAPLWRPPRASPPACRKLTPARVVHGLSRPTPNWRQAAMTLAVASNRPMVAARVASAGRVMPTMRAAAARNHAPRPSRSQVRTAGRCESEGRASTEDMATARIVDRKASRLNHNPSAGRS